MPEGSSKLIFNHKRNEVDLKHFITNLHQSIFERRVQNSVVGIVAARMKGPLLYDYSPRAKVANPRKSR